MQNICFNYPRNFSQCTVAYIPYICNLLYEYGMLQFELPFHTLMHTFQCIAFMLLMIDVFDGCAKERIHFISNNICAALQCTNLHNQKLNTFPSMNKKVFQIEPIRNHCGTDAVRNSEHSNYNSNKIKSVFPPQNT